jgi:hypothetical protein
MTREVKEGQIWVTNSVGGLPQRAIYEIRKVDGKTAIIRVIEEERWSKKSFENTLKVNHAKLIWKG